VSKARRLVQSRLCAAAEGRAHTILRNRHKAEYDELFAQLKKEMFEANGPLPGDEYL
jgi:hypothetical protein